MSTVDAIITAIERLPADEVARLQAWLAEYAERLWDEQIERDVRDGRLDTLIDEALEEHRAGRTCLFTAAYGGPQGGSASAF
jgi:hypothetical protein